MSKVYKEHGVDPKDYFFAAAEYPMMIISQEEDAPILAFSVFILKYFTAENYIAHAVPKMW